MKNKNLLFVAAISLVLFSCKKEKKAEPMPIPTPTPVAPAPTPTAASEFIWNENGGADIKADSAFFETPYKTIKAYKSGKFIEINLSGTIPATYPIGSVNAVALLIGSQLYQASSGNVVISANASAKASGTFTSTGSGASITSLGGKFTDIKVR
ncbi:MAG: hypothetical protein IT239_01260 [Bacteroidia bacterium]|nr:hypothetical protein [Bacteroidia bacterium]